MIFLGKECCTSVLTDVDWRKLAMWGLAGQARQEEMCPPSRCMVGISSNARSSGAAISPGVLHWGGGLPWHGRGLL